ncbi:MAG: M23 family metallopeptidase [Clostridium sp.]|uniref:M23 family metallopeptidase n=1 Tax=Clostridium sp. DSM 8431 TaxID=1761781 RepID=UPI0008F26235|nr:M23 family metallopeptidase [Clostridium sp. DSM 8431]MCR4943401.1 M23 family metallopeptidase [Clostridium sp.]SFU67041.1 Peptidase family M23 [Clostridium sp. DSM 8431]
MGNYREQYERYYGNIKRQGAASYKRISSIKEGSFPSEVNKESIIERMTRKFIWQLSGSLLLLLIVIGLKYVAVESASSEFYDLSKEVLDKDIDVGSFVMNLDILDNDNYKEKALDYIDEVKSQISGERTLKELIKEDYIQPVSGKIKYINGESKGVAISANDNEEVNAAYGGVVEEVVTNDDNKYILINHGNGTETYYESLSEINVEAGQIVDKGEVIGKCGNIDMTDKKGLIFKFIYLGNEKNPSDVMDLSSLEEV